MAEPSSGKEGRPLNGQMGLSVNTYEIGDQWSAARQDRRRLPTKELLPLITS